MCGSGMKKTISVFVDTLLLRVLTAVIPRLFGPGESAAPLELIEKRTVLTSRDLSVIGFSGI